MSPRIPLLLSLLACDGGAESDTAPACDTAPEVSWEGWADGFFATWCRGCHSATTPDRHGAPEGIDFDTEEQVWSSRDAIRNAVLVTERMPIAGGLLDEDRVLLDAYLSCSR